MRACATGERGPAQLVHSYGVDQRRVGMGRKSGLDLADGASFFPDFLDSLGSLRPKVDPGIALATDLNWAGGKIESLVIGRPKSWRRIWRVIRRLSPRFISGKTRIDKQWTRVPAAWPASLRYLLQPSHAMTLWHLGFREAAEGQVAARCVTQETARIVDRKASKKTEAHFARIRSAIRARGAVNV